MGGSPDHEIRSLSVIDGRVWASGWIGIYLYDKSSDLFSKPRNLTEDAAAGGGNSCPLAAAAPGQGPGGHAARHRQGGGGA